ncbi:MAG TPA: hypothetical protein PKE58_09700 [Acidobacteriota bacterium]|nr:hypothetical protein [Acidobacteriota bacterium]
MMESLIGIVLKRCLKSANSWEEMTYVGKSPCVKELLRQHYTDIDRSSKLFSSVCGDGFPLRTKSAAYGFPDPGKELFLSVWSGEILEILCFECQENVFSFRQILVYDGISLWISPHNQSLPNPFFGSSSNDIRNLERFLTCLTLTTPGTNKKLLANLISIQPPVSVFSILHP